jgi:chitin synthase
MAAKADPEVSKLLETPEEEEGPKCHPWNLFVQASTCCFLPVCLRKCGKMYDPSVQYAWREKMALIIIIVLCCAILGFLTFGLQVTICMRTD